MPGLKRVTTLVLIGMLIAAGLISCDKKETQAEPIEVKEPSESSDPIVTWTPVEGGSAKLTYQMVVDQTPVYTAADTEEILLKWRFDPDKPKQPQEFFGDKEDGSYFVQVEGLREGVPCFSWFDIPVKYSVFGLYHPYPECSFSLTIQGIPEANTPNRGHNCGPEVDGFIKAYPAEAIYIPPPDTQMTIPNTLSTTIQVNEWATLTLTLSDVVVPASTECQW